jgi:hypothetical protein
MSQTDETTVTPTVPKDSGDPFARLHKMSRTAGAGHNEYVAVSNTAVTALFFGLASALVVLGWPLVVIPVAGVVISLLALKQIRGSNGTQTGAVIALAGLLFSVASVGFVGFTQVNSYLTTRADVEDISKVIERFGEHIKHERLDDAYAMMTPAFTKRINRDRYDFLFKSMRDSPYMGKVNWMKSNGLFKFDTDRLTGLYQATGVVLVSVGADASLEPERPGMVFRKINGVWMIDDIPMWFPNESGPQDLTTTPQR